MSQRAPTDSLCLSYATKIQVYCECLLELEPDSEFAKFYLNEAVEMLKDGKRSLLRAHSKELDVQLRESLTHEQKQHFVQRMRECGVHPEHLPQLASTRKLKAILRRGTIRNEEELSVVRAALDGTALGQVSAEERRSLGALFDLATSSAPRVA